MHALWAYLQLEAGLCAALARMPGLGLARGGMRVIVRVRDTGFRFRFHLRELDRTTWVTGQDYMGYWTGLHRVPVISVTAT